MDVIREVQTNYHLPDKARTIGELLAEARQQSEAAKLAGHDIMALERFDPDTRHMIVFDVLSHDSPMDWKGEKMYLFLTDAGYGKVLGTRTRVLPGSGTMRRCLRGTSAMTAKTGSYREPAKNVSKRVGNPPFFLL